MPLVEPGERHQRQEQHQLYPHSAEDHLPIVPEGARCAKCCPANYITYLNICHSAVRLGDVVDLFSCGYDFTGFEELDVSYQHHQRSLNI